VELERSNTPAFLYLPLQNPFSFLSLCYPIIPVMHPAAWSSLYSCWNEKKVGNWFLWLWPVTIKVLAYVPVLSTLCGGMVKSPWVNTVLSSLLVFQYVRSSSRLWYAIVSANMLLILVARANPWLLPRRTQILDFINAPYARECCVFLSSQCDPKCERQITSCLAPHLWRQRLYLL